MLAYDRLVELFTLNWAGWFCNRTTRGPAKQGERAGSETGHGYRRIWVDGIRYYEHHLVWFYVHGVWVEELDHKDGDGCNNAPDNLRPCTRTQNRFNSETTPGISGLRGAYWNPRSRNWFSKIQVGGQTIWLGTYSTPEEAHEAYKVGADRIAGEFALHNRSTE